ncbi:MAG: hypothetical protein NTY46_15900, partial [Candidatus Sumerlaeota bacterium]|nr:hypothetical protein [Candidatus Sumerlaeota bacterium]
MKSALRESVRPFTLTALTVAIFWVMMGTARIYADQREYPRFAAAESSRMITPPAQGETIEGVCDFIKRKIDQVQTMKCEVELSKWRERKPRRVSTGPLELEREKGAYVRLTRKDETSEYIVNAVMIWDYDLKDKKAQYIPTIMPIIGFFVKEAMALNILLSLDKDTLKLRGSVEVEGEPC